MHHVKSNIILMLLTCMLPKYPKNLGFKKYKFITFFKKLSFQTNLESYSKAKYICRLLAYFIRQNGSMRWTKRKKEWKENKIREGREMSCASVHLTTDEPSLLSITKFYLQQHSYIYHKRKENEGLAFPPSNHLLPNSKL